MLDPQVSRFWQAALQSGLMNAQGLSACWNAIAPAKREAREHLDRRLARQAVQSQSLTLWQAQQLLAGRTSGFRVDRYILLELIGQGGMGRVYLARDTRLNRRVALKILSPERVNNPRAIARFRREARVGAQLQHENLVRIYDFGESNGRYYLVMEYIEGKTIGTLLSEQGPMPSATAVRLVRQVALGLEHAHRKGLIHRDVNPYNILVMHDGVAKLADLGLAIDLAEQDRVTREGATVGTFDYVAPEQARQSHAADIRSDIYSLGCTLYHMIAGQVPFPSPSLPEKLFAHQALEPISLVKLVPGVPDGLAEVVQRMMRKSPDERYSTPLQVAQDLALYADEATSVGEGDASPPLRDTKSEPAVETSGVLVSEATPALPELAAVTVVAGSPAGTDTSRTAVSDSSGEASEAIAPLLTPAHALEESAPELPLALNLGLAPERSLCLPRPKSRFGHLFLTRAVRMKRSPVHVDQARWAFVMIKSAMISGLRPRWLWALFALIGLMTALIIMMATTRFLGYGLEKPAIQRQLDTNSARGLSAARTADVSLDGPRQSSKTTPSIIVRTEGEHVREFRNLFDAMNTAMAIRNSWVELRNREPLRLALDQSFDLVSGRGDLSIRAAAGFTPVIELELRRTKPILTTGSGISLELSGLTIVAHTPDVPVTSGASRAPPPLITTAGKIRINRCAFRLLGSYRVKGSRAIYCDGGVLSVSRCWFEGFDKAIELTAPSGRTARIGQTMIVRSSASSPTELQPSQMYGWGVRLQLMSEATPSPHPQLSLEHCTVEGAGLFELVDGHVATPFCIEVKQCAVQTHSLLAWNPKIPGDEVISKLQWEGKGNQFNILGRFWILRSRDDGILVPWSDVTDLESWCRFVNKESDPIRASWKYFDDPAARTRPPQPGDFTIEASGVPQADPGADPELVGPWSKI
jgi:serine/threonine-protein kinase